MKRVLLTGASGFVGINILKRLIKESVYIRTVARNPSKLSNYKKHIDIIYTNDLFTESKESLMGILDDIDTVIHCAWFMDHGVNINSEKNINCLQGSIRLAQSCKTAGVSKFIGIGTCYEYDQAVMVMNTHCPLRPSNLYGSCKASLFFTLFNYFQNTNITFLWCRLFNLYGDNENVNRLFPHLKQKLEQNEIVHLTKGAQIRDYLHIDDAVLQILKAISDNRSGPVNICSGIPITVKQFCINIAHNYGKEYLLKFNSKPLKNNEPYCIVGVPSIN